MICFQPPLDRVARCQACVLPAMPFAMSSSWSVQLCLGRPSRRKEEAVLGVNVSPSKATSFRYFLPGSLKTFPISSNWADRIAVEVGFCPAHCLTFSLVMRDKKEGGIRNMVLKQLAWKPSILLRSDLESHADAVPYLSMLVISTSNKNIFLDLARTGLFQIGSNALNSARAAPIFLLTSHPYFPSAWIVEPRYSIEVFGGIASPLGARICTSRSIEIR